MNYKSIEQLNYDIKNNLYKIPKDIDLIVGIPKSGMLVANIIALYLNKPITDIDSFKEKRIYNSGKTKNTNTHIKEFNDIKKVIVIEDSSDSGNSIKEAKKKLKDHNNIEILYFAMYVTKEAKKNVDIYIETIEQPRIFEWNLMHNQLLNEACVDIDGVLCYDPTKEENDDGEKYKEFIKNATPKFIPTRKIKYLVTSRLEKYRTLTEEWLKKNNIEYDELIMMNLETAEERQKLGNHGEFKAKIYKEKIDAILFIESEIKQAKIISKITNKTVICTENNTSSQQSNINKIKYKIKTKIKNILKKLELQNENK